MNGVPLTDIEQRVADVLAKRAISDRLQPSLTARVAEVRASLDADTTVEEPDASVETETGTITRYLAWSFHQRHVVIEMPSRQVEAAFGSREEAETHAEQLNTWLSRRPMPDARYRRFTLPPEPTEAALIEMLDQMAEIDQPPKAALRELKETIRVAYDAATVADRAARRTSREEQEMSEQAVTHVEVAKDSASEWRFSARAANGEIVAVSEGYTEKRSALEEAAKLFPAARVEVVESFLDGEGGSGDGEG